MCVWHGIVSSECSGPPDTSQDTADSLHYSCAAHAAFEKGNVVRIEKARILQLRTTPCTSSHPASGQVAPATVLRLATPAVTVKRSRSNDSGVSHTRDSDSGLTAAMKLLLLHVLKPVRMRAVQHYCCGRMQLEPDEHSQVNLVCNTVTQAFLVNATHALVTAAYMCINALLTSRDYVTSFCMLMCMCVIEIPTSLCESSV